MVGIVIVSHSHELAVGLRLTALQMSQQQGSSIAAAGGLEDGSLGTSFEKIERAINEVYDEDGVLVLMDLGSAVMTAQTVVEMLSPEKQRRVRLSNAPLVEGAIAAAATAAAGRNLKEVQRAAEAALDMPKVCSVTTAQKDTALCEKRTSEEVGRLFSADLVLPNPLGLHARPAMQIVKKASKFKAQITLQNLTQNRVPVNAKMPVQLSFAGSARQGETVRLVAVGEDAEQAIEELSSLVKRGFGEMEEKPVPMQMAEVTPPTQEIKVPEGPLPGKIQGLGVSEGSAVAPAFPYRPGHHGEEQVLKTRHRTIENKDEEIALIRKAWEEAKSQLKSLQAKVELETDEKTGRIFEFHRMILEDPQLLKDVEAEITAEGCGAEIAVQKVFTKWQDLAGGLHEIMRARAADLRDVEKRLLRILAGVEELDLSELNHPAIIIAPDLTPSDMAKLDRSLVQGIATSVGGTTSHTAILARTWGIPAVMGLGGILLAVKEGTLLALDGRTGVVEVAPSDERIRKYQEQAEHASALKAKAMALKNDPAVTKDGHHLKVMANVGDLDSAREALEYGAEGIGVLRTEFLYLNRFATPDEEEQYRAYRAIVELMGRRPVVIRTLDIGGDKPLPYLDQEPELNPFLGVRGIRFCLKRPDIFQPQLRALLRAGVDGNLKVMFPMLTTIDEVHQAKAALSDARESLMREGAICVSKLEVGIMIETPAAAINADILAREVDFFSIGTNDLTQYILACDRTNQNLSYLYHTQNRAVIRTIKQVIDAAHGEGKWVAVCGELENREVLKILLGLGVDEFSMIAPRIPYAKEFIRQLYMSKALAQANRLI